MQPKRKLYLEFYIVNFEKSNKISNVTNQIYLNPISASVSPVQVSGNPIYSNAIWVVDLRGNQHGGITPINAGSSNGPNLIIRPIDITFNWVIIYSYGMANVINLHN